MSTIQANFYGYTPKTAVSPNYSTLFVGDFLGIENKEGYGNIWGISRYVGDELGARFTALAKKWRQDTLFDSSLSDIYFDPSYKEIMRMGVAGVPFVLRALRDNPERWLHALRFMAPENPAAGISDFEQAREAWLTWGYKSGHL